MEYRGTDGLHCCFARSIDPLQRDRNGKWLRRRGSRVDRGCALAHSCCRGRTCTDLCRRHNTTDSCRGQPVPMEYRPDSCFFYGFSVADNNLYGHCDRQWLRISGCCHRSGCTLTDSGNHHTRYTNMCRRICCADCCRNRRLPVEYRRIRRHVN